MNGSGGVPASCARTSRGAKTKSSRSTVETPRSETSTNVPRFVRRHWASPDSEAVTPGRKVVVFPWIGCGKCPICARGDEQNCSRPRSLGIYRGGGYATHVLVPHARYLLDMGDLKPEVAAPYACSGLTTYSALRKLDARVLREEPILVIGAGGLGLMCLGIMKALGAHGAVVADIDAGKREA